MFTRQPEYVVKRYLPATRLRPATSAIVFHGSIKECEKFFEWLGNEYPNDRYEVEAWR